MTISWSSALPVPWIEVPLITVAEVRLGRQRSPERAVGKYMRPYLRAANVTWTGLDLSDVKEMDFNPAEQETYRLRAGDILLSEASGSAGEVGKPAIWNEEIEACCFQNTLLRVRPQHGMTRYLYYHFLADASLGRFGERSRGVGIHHLGAEGLSSWRVRIAPLAEQRRIVAEIEKQFTRLDAAVAALKHARAELKRYRAAVLKAACEGRLVPTEAALAAAEGRDYEPAPTLLARILAQRRARWEAEQQAKYRKSGKTPPLVWRDRYKEPAGPDVSESPELSEGWCWATFDVLLAESLRNGHSAKATGTDHGVRTLTLSAVTNGDFSESNTKLTVADPRAVADLWLRPGDLLIERSNTPELVGTSRLYRGKEGFAIFPDLLIRARLVTDASSEFAETVLQSERVRQYLRGRAQGIAGSMPKIDQGTIRSTPIALPPLAEQQRIVAEVERRLSVVHELEGVVAANLKRAATLRQAILKRAFSGRLVAQDPNDEPASVLLERIRAQRNGATAEGTPRRGRKRTAGATQLTLPV